MVGEWNLPMSALFSPLTLRGVTIPNRIMVSPMCQYSAEAGRANAWHLSHLMSMAVSGAGLLCLEATAVEPAGRITPGDLGLWDDTTEAALGETLAAVRDFADTKIAIQLGHAGRKSSHHVPWAGGGQVSLAEGGWQADAPSAIPQLPEETAPTALDAAGLARIREAFAAAAARSARLGIDAIEVHGAHGYLLHQFLSPIANQRTDAYGGSLENRMRFPLEVFDAVRQAFPDDRPVGMRLSATDWVDGGWDLESTIALAERLKARGADWVAASSGGVSPQQQVPVGPSYQVPFAAKVREATGVATVAVGLITEPQQAEDIVARGEADIVALARGLLYNPRWPWHAAAELGATVSAPPQYWRSPPRGVTGLFGPEARTFGR